ncbi:MAG: hypothetical protein Q4G28_10370 [Neisseria sp.]|nr:hypothetical protein [Neisseria sp.]
MTSPAPFTPEQQQRYEALFQKMRGWETPLDRKVTDYHAKLGLTAADLPVLAALTQDMRHEAADGEPEDFFVALHAAYALGGYADETASRAMIAWIMADTVSGMDELTYEYLDMFLPQGLFHLPFLLEQAARETGDQRELMLSTASMWRNIIRRQGRRWWRCCWPNSNLMRCRTGFTIRCC